MIETSVRSKFWRIVIFLSFAGLYLVLASSDVVSSAVNTLIGTHYRAANTFVLMILVIMTTVIMLINLYSYAMFREVRYLLFTILALLLTFGYSLQLLGVVDTVIPSPLADQTMVQVSLIVTITILIILLAKLALVRRDITAKIPLRHVPPMLLLILLALVLLYFGLRENNIINNQWVLGVLFVLIFTNILGYLIKYVAEGDRNAESLLFVGIIHLTTFSYPPFGNLQEPYVILVANIVRLVSLFYMSHMFYTNMFTSYVGKMIQIDAERTEYTTNLEKIVEARTQELLIANNMLEAEIDSAKELQKSMMPAKEINYKGVSFISENIPCEKMSGDFFDIYDIDDNRVGMYILDVSGHGINAALMNIYCYHYIRSTSPLVKRYLGDKPSRNLLHLYEEFNKMGFPDEMHIVLLIASYDMRNRKLSYCSGGLNGEPIVVRRSGDITRLNQSSGFPIVKMGTFFTPEYIDAHINLDVGDRIIFYTDGLVDVRQPYQLQEEDVMELMLEHVDQPIGDLERAIVARIDPFRAELVDDVSFFIMEVGS